MQLVIAEKPSVAKSIADVIGATKSEDGYVTGNGYIVSWCVGHLLELQMPDDYSEKWSGGWKYDTLPIIPEEWKHKVSTGTKKQYKVLEKLLKSSDVTEVICATDAGREGELIFRLVYNHSRCNKPFKRLWISSMEDSAIRDGFANLKNGHEYDDLYDSALCRSKADWLIGMNGTRLFTVLYGKRLNVGRVQTPTLAMLVEREEKIRSFVKTPYYKAHIICGGFDAVTDRIDEKNKADWIAGACQNRQALIHSVIKEQKSVAPPKLYDLTSLQRDANRLFSFTAKQTLEYAQSLYEKKLVTYPRTDSQYLTDDMTESAKNVIIAIQDKMEFAQGFTLYPEIPKVLNSKKVSDHHAIIPTVEIRKVDIAALPITEKKILCLVANRLLCATSESYVYEKTNVEVTCDSNAFFATGKVEKKPGWRALDKTFRTSLQTKEEKEPEEQALPEVEEGMTFENVQSSVSEHFTSPPKHFTEDTLLSAMENAGAREMSDEVERKGLGTPATRADLIEKLVSNGFIIRKNKQMLPTDDGVKLITVLPDIVKSPQLTADWENDLVLVGKGEKSGSDFMQGIEQMVINLVKNYNSISEDNRGMFGTDKESLGTCPHCGGAILSGKYGAYCQDKCGMLLGKYYGAKLTDAQMKDVLAGKRILLKGLTSKAGNLYDLYITPDGIEEFQYEKNGEKITGYQFKYTREYPEKNK